MSNASPSTGQGSGPGYRRLTRSHDRMIAGVCGGVAEYLHVDPTLIPVLYLFCWAIIPRA